jgi:multisubunit Na+/H+ antiporter MnhB subunit
MTMPGTKQGLRFKKGPPAHPRKDQTHTVALENKDALSGAAKVTAAASCLALTLAMAWAVWRLPPYSDRMSKLVNANLALSGVENPVTAVLLNFRGYDTLLEIGVLLLAAVGVMSSAASSLKPPAAGPSPLLTLLLRRLLPFMILICGYVLWVGKYAPGGAFQAGALMAAGGILYVSATGDDEPFAGRFVSLAMGLGLTTFVMVALATMMAGGSYLQYPVALAGTLILVIEAAATVSIAAILIILYIGAGPDPNVAKPDGRRRRFSFQEGKQNR